jgi:hypothetical protein
MGYLRWQTVPAVAWKPASSSLCNSHRTAPSQKVCIFLRYLYTRRIPLYKIFMRAQLSFPTSELTFKGDVMDLIFSAAILGFLIVTWAFAVGLSRLGDIQ